MPLRGSPHFWWQKCDSRAGEPKQDLGRCDLRPLGVTSQAGPSVTSSPAAPSLHLPHAPRYPGPDGTIPSQGAGPWSSGPLASIVAVPRLRWPVSPPSLPCLLPGPGIVRASSVFPILSTILLLLGGLCIGAGRFYSRKNNIVLSAGILFVAAGELATLVSTAESKTGRRGGVGEADHTVCV